MFENEYLPLGTGNMFWLFTDNAHKNKCSKLGIGTTTPTALFSVAERFKVDSATGSLSFTHPAGAISFAAPTPSANQPMLTMFSSGSFNFNRMLVGHSSAYPTWGLQYQDTADNFVFRAGSAEIFTIKLSDRKIRYTDGNQGTGKVLTSDAGGAASWEPALISSDWATSLSNSRDTAIDGTCMKVRTILAPELTPAVLNKGLVSVYMRVGSIGPYQLPYVTEAGDGINLINFILRAGHILVYRHTYNSCRFSSSNPPTYTNEPVMVNLAPTIEYRYVIRKN